MTDTPNEGPLHDGPTAADKIRAQIEAMREAEASQPDRLAHMRTQLAIARQRGEVEEPFADHLRALPTYNADGEPTGVAAIPSIDCKEVFGTRLALELLGGTDEEPVQVISRYMNIDHAALIFSAALDYIASDVVPALLAIAENQASDWDIRVRLVDAARAAWDARIGELAGGAL